LEFPCKIPLAHQQKSSHSYIENSELFLVLIHKADEMGNESQFLNLWDFGGSCFKGTCYQAANWSNVGQTKGHAKKGNDYLYHG
jgi:hypothetical protein